MRNPGPARRVSPSVADSKLARQRDAELLAAFREGDEGAFEELVWRHRRRLFVIALRRIGNVELAEDAVQVTLTKAYRHLAVMEGDVDVSAWLAAVVQNAALDQVRSEVRQRNLADRAWAAAPERADRRGSDRHRDRNMTRMERYELGKILFEGIKALPDPYRRSLELFHLQGLPVEEIGAVLELNVNTVKSHLARGRGLLRRKLTGKLSRGDYL